MERLAGRSLVIIGMMASGKTQIGRLVAERMGLHFFDLDAAIEEAAGQCIADIFKSYGEGEFRRMEQVVLQRLLADRQSVLALGGGAWMSESVRALCMPRCVSIWLDVPVEILIGRAARSNRRPLLDGPDPGRTIRSLLALRQPQYEMATIRARADGNLRQTTEEVLNQLRRWLSENSTT